eukprot:scaffold103052_cov29-Tisochrysis_lutea.AAC.2
MSERLPTEACSAVPALRGRPPTMPSRSPALTTSCPKMDGHTEPTNSSNRCLDDAMSRMAWRSRTLRFRSASPLTVGGSVPGGLGP